MKKRWKFLLLLSGLIAGSFFGLGYYLFSNNAPIITGEVIRNIEYKPGLKLDIYTPTKTVYEKNPVVIYIHGGAWITGIKEGLNFNRFNQAANDLREAGYTIVAINYTLAESDKSPFPACIEDGVDAVIWVHQNASEFNFDVTNVGLFGESAGAHIAMMVAYNQSSYFSNEASQPHFNYVADIYGPNRLINIYNAPLVDTLYAKLGQLPTSFSIAPGCCEIHFWLRPKTRYGQGTADHGSLFTLQLPNHIRSSHPDHSGR